MACIGVWTIQQEEIRDYRFVLLVHGTKRQSLAGLLTSVHSSRVICTGTTSFLPVIMQHLPVPSLDLQRPEDILGPKPRGENNDVRRIGLCRGTHSMGEDLNNVILQKLEIRSMESVKV